MMAKGSTRHRGENRSGVCSTNFHVICVILPKIDYSISTSTMCAVLIRKHCRIFDTGVLESISKTSDAGIPFLLSRTAILFDGFTGTADGNIVNVIKEQGGSPGVDMEPRSRRQGGVRRKWRWWRKNEGKDSRSIPHEDRKPFPLCPFKSLAVLCILLHILSGISSLHSGIFEDIKVPGDDVGMTVSPYELLAMQQKFISVVLCFLLCLLSRIVSLVICGSCVRGSNPVRRRAFAFTSFGKS